MGEEKEKNLAVMIVAGESSGDLHAGRLCRRLRESAPDLELFGMGGEEMASAGVELVERISPAAVVGFWEAFKSLARHRRIFRSLLRELDRRRPRAVILVDYPGFNLRLARAVHGRGVKVIYYITPQVWAWGRRRVEKLRKYVDRLLVIFRFERDFFADHGLEADFVGHPILDGIDAGRTAGPARSRLETGSGPVIALLPGSRHSEIDRLLPLLADTAGIISRSHPRAEFLLPLASPELKGRAEEILSGRRLPIRLLSGRAREVLAASDLALAASGTVTLEAAYFTVPVIVVYRLSILSWLIARSLIKIPYISLVNVILGEEAVPEFIQFRARPPLVAAAAERYLAPGPDRDRLVESLKTARDRLGGPGAADRAARIILKTVIPGSTGVDR